MSHDKDSEVTFGLAAARVAFRLGLEVEWQYRGDWLTLRCDPFVHDAPYRLAADTKPTVAQVSALLGYV